MKQKFQLLVALTLFFNLNAMAQVKLPALISNGMVLQRNVPLNIWGWAKAGEKVTVTFKNKTYQTTTTTEGKWKLQLAKAEAGGPFEMEIKASNQLLIKDILIGEVWLCSGQSNMAFKMDLAKAKYPEVIANATNPNIRQLNVPEKYNFGTPIADVKMEGWKTADPQNVLKFSAVGYFFAKEIYAKYKVPIGLILSSWGGTPAEAWMSEEALIPFPKFAAAANRLKDSVYFNGIKAKDNKAREDWYQFIKKGDLGYLEATKWSAPELPTADWKTLQMPGTIETQGAGNVDGAIWFRKEIILPEGVQNAAATLYMGYLMDQDTIYVNGVKVGVSPNKYAERKYAVPQNLLKAGRNVITVRLINRSGPGGFIKDKKYELVVGNQSFKLNGDWLYKIGVKTPPQPNETVFHYQPGGVYNAMIYPLLNYNIKGALWYQGEANVGRAPEYLNLFQSLIVDWRKQFNQGDFPFLFVQLANYLETKNEPADSKWAELREAQLLTLNTQKTGMAVTADIGEWNDVHPLNKEDVGKRLALAAQKVAYNEKNVVFSGPIYQSHAIKANKIWLSFNHVGSGLMAKGNPVLNYFSIAGADGKFVWAKAEIVGDQVVVWNDTIQNPTAVRYGWADNPAGANLYNKEGLPASSFRTDRE